MRFKFIAIILALVNIVVFVIQNMVPGFTDVFVLVPASNHVYELITSMFLHGSLAHLFYNMFALFVFGLILENSIGSKKFVYIYFVSGIIASFSAFIFYYNTPVLGASGAIYGVMGALGAIRPKLIVWVLGAPMPMFVAVIIWFFISLAGIFSAGNVAHGAHLFGLVAGIIYGFCLRKYFSFDDKSKKKKRAKISREKIKKWEDEYM